MNTTFLRIFFILAAFIARYCSADDGIATTNSTITTGIAEDATLSPSAYHYLSQLSSTDASAVFQSNNIINILLISIIPVALCLIGLCECIFCLVRPKPKAAVDEDNAKKPVESKVDETQSVVFYDYV